MFITFEGYDGTGKTTQARLLVKYLVGCGWLLKFLREPGSTLLSEDIRGITRHYGTEMTPITGLFLYLAARADLVANVIRPTLATGWSVVCDRYVDSTFAYQVGGHGTDWKMVELANEWATSGLMPDLTFLLDAPYEVCTERLEGRPGNDRTDVLGRAFFNRVRDMYLELADRYSDRIQVVDATKDIDAVHGVVRERVETFSLVTAGVQQ